MVHMLKIYFLKDHFPFKEKNAIFQQMLLVM